MPRLSLLLEPLEDRWAPATLIVNSANDNTTSDSVLTLREALNLVNAAGNATTALGRSLTSGESAQILGGFGSNDTVRFDTSLTNQTLSLTTEIGANNAAFFLNKPVNIIGPGAGLLTLDAGSNKRFFWFEAANFSISGLSLQNGVSNGGGAIFVNSNGGLTVTNCVFQNNNSSNGAGGAILGRGTLTVVGSTFTGNSTTSGVGGAVGVSSGTAVVKNSTFSGNSASNNGGALNVNGATLTVVNCTVIQNTTNTDNTTGIGAVHKGGGGALLYLFNSIVAGNVNGIASPTSDDVQGPIDSSSSNNIIGDANSSGGLTNGQNGNIVGNAGSGVLPLTSILSTTLANNGGQTKTYALIQNSPALAAGSAAVANYSAYDQREAFRDPGAPDIGAYEVQHPLSPVGTPSTYAMTFQPKPNSSQNEAFIKGLYQSTLLRPADSAGLSGWLSAMNSGASKTDIAYGFVNSVENRTNQVIFYYKYFLGRNPDSAGLQGWVNALQTGADEGAVMSGFLLSPEFTGQNNNASFVNLMYYAILGRPADPAGFAGWVAQLNTGQATRDQVGNGFLRSSESITRVVLSDFGSYLKRTIPASAAQPYVAQIQAGTTFGRVAANLLGSDEFFVAAGQNL